MKDAALSQPSEAVQAAWRPLERRLAFILLGLVALSLVMVLSIGIGPVYIGPATVVDALFGRADATSNTIVREIRAPRVLVGAMVGASLAMAGAMLQGVTRNPLGDPHIFGVSAGAGLVAVSFIVLAPTFSDPVWEPAPLGVKAFALTAVQPLSVLGGLAGGGFAYLMAWRGGASPARLALAGIAVTSVLTAVTSAILVTSSFSAQIGLRWLIGGLLGRSWLDFRLLWPYVVVGGGLALLLARQLNVIALGDELATSLGQRVERMRLALTATAALLASAAVSIAGLVGFLGLIIPHVVRLLIGNDYRFLLPASAIYGAVLLVAADTAARTVLDPKELPVGVLTALLGGPVFILLVRRRA